MFEVFVRYFLVCSMFVACSTPPAANVREVVVLAEKAPCVGEASYLCTQVKVDGATESSLYYDGIKGWLHIWGTEFSLRVDEQTVEDPAEDGSSITWTHLATTGTTLREPGDTFDWTVNTRVGDFLAISGAGGALLDGKGFACADQAVCDALGAALDDSGSLTFAYGDLVEGPLVLVSVGD